MARRVKHATGRFNIGNVNIGNGKSIALMARVRVEDVPPEELDEDNNYIGPLLDGIM